MADLHRDRRRWLYGVAGIGTGAVAGYFARHRVFKSVAETIADDQKPFRDQARNIMAAHQRQTAETVAALKRRYEGEVYGQARVWDMIQAMGQVVDPTDTILFCTSQLVHVRQVLAAMARDQVKDETLILAALLHDMGKVIALRHAAPEDVFGSTLPLGEPAAGAGLAHVVFQFGHPEYVWSRLKDHVTPEVAWLLRFHGVPLDDVRPYLDAQDRAFTEKYLVPFRKYDLWTKSMVEWPALDWQPYRELIEAHFPAPIRF